MTLLHTLTIAFTNVGTGHINKGPLFSLVNGHINWMFMLLLPLTALLFRLFFFRGKVVLSKDKPGRVPNYTEQLINSLYWMGFQLLVFALILNPLYYLCHSFIQLEVLIFTFLLFQFIHYGYAYYQFYQRKGWRWLLLCFFIAGLVLFILFWITILGLIVYYRITA
ncbi:MAG: hypothetical protein EOO01_36470 [Chitinophagaceae bacterium]|nr:MAG: hypothetical protein EOO01_36470 [Chitinophagaceae bacterium]